MLQVKTIAQGFELKNGAAKVVLTDSSVELGDTVVNQSGEYEAAGVEVIYGQNAALIGWDNLQIVYIFNLDKPTAFETSQFSPSDVIIFSAKLAKLTKAGFNETLESFDPKLVILAASVDRTELEAIVKSEPVELGKMSAQTLPEDGREFFILQ